MLEPRATVVVLTYNPGPIFRDVLNAVSHQVAPFPFEVLVIDSGSTDGTPQVAQEFGTRLLGIAQEDFQHGRTRNFAMESAEGEIVVFLTHDAVPASPFWLREMVACFELDPDVAAVFGRHLPSPGCDPIVARDTMAHFKNFGPDDRPSIQRIDPGPQGWGLYQSEEAILGFFSDVNGAVRKSAWRKVPYLELDYAEDQRLGRDLLEAGFMKVYSPSATVYHSHTYGLAEYFRRMFDEFRGLKVAVGYIEQRSLVEVLKDSLRAARADSAFLRSLKYLPLMDLWRRVMATFPRAFARRLAAYLAIRQERIPSWANRRLSLEGTGSVGRTFTIGGKVLREQGIREFKRLLRRRAGRLIGHTATAQPPPMPFVRFDPSMPAPLLPVNEVPQSLTLNWVTPPFGIASGGHMTIARIIRQLERFGHRNRIYLYHPSKWMHEADAESAKRLIRKFFQPVDAEVFIGVDEMQDADALIATSWETAYLTHGLGHARLRCYFVQDFEPSFYPVGSDFRLAENTYRFGYQSLTAGRWLARILSRDYGAQAMPFDLAPDHDVYHEAPRLRRDAKTLIFYGRWMTHRRGFELASHAFELLLEKVPDVNILIFGAESLPQRLPFRHRNLGVMHPPQLARLYNQATVGFVISLTNPSLVPLEMMACGLPVMDIDGESTRAFFEGHADALVLADPFPARIADELASLLTDEGRRERISAAGLQYASNLGWEESGRQVERGILSGLEQRAMDVHQVD